MEIKYVTFPPKIAKQQFKDCAHAIADNSMTATLEPDNSVYAGAGSCRSCSCRGYQRGNKLNYCDNCNHHYSQHHD